jgi:uncharacterized protein (TIGR00369 family)
MPPATQEPAVTDPLHRRIADSFARQGLMQTLGARLLAVGPGTCSLTAPLGPGVTQQHGAAHAGLTFALGDSAAGYAALTLLPDGAEVMTSEIKIHLLRPGVGDRLEARGRVLKPGRRLIVVQSDVCALRPDGSEVHIATLLGTMVPVDAQAVSP